MNFDKAAASAARMGITQDGIINAIQGMWYIDSGMSSTYAQAMTAVGLGEAPGILRQM